MRDHGRRVVSLLTSVAFLSASLPGGARAQQAGALPTAGSVVSGATAISSPSATSVLITQSSRNAILNWGSFSIGAGNTVRFENGSGATLNRVTGLSRSQIDGALTATGSVYLVNPNGITVGPTGAISTGGSFVASTHDVSDAQFNAGGAMTFRGSSTASVINYGTIGSLGGDVALIARKVENAGTLSAPNGTVALAAGYEVLVRDTALSDGKFMVKVGGADTEAKTTGRIKAAEVELRANGGNVYALAGNTHGLTKATGIANKGGRVFLTAGDGGAVTVSQKVVARGPSSGGKARGGEIRVSGGKTTVSGTLDARGKGDTGGTIVVTAQDIALASTAVLDASGTSGGTVLVGGDYQGGKDAATKYLSEAVATAQTTSVAAGATLRANGSAGDGGRVVVWSDHLTTFAGAISATGVTAGGNAEVSGKALLDFTGTADLRSERGRFGTLLLDPYNVTISSATDAGMSGFTAGANDSVLNVTTLTTALASANVVVSTGVGGSQAGDITVAAPITWSANTVLTFQAAGNIAFNAAVTATGTSAGLVISYGTGKDYSVNAPITLSGANATLRIGATGALQSYTLIHDMAALVAIGSPDRSGARTGLSGNYALAQNLDASGTTYAAPLIGDRQFPFSGTFAGLAHTLSNLTINARYSVLGLFGATSGGAVIRDLGLVGGSVVGDRDTSNVGSLVGFNAGTITNAYATGSVEGGLYVGGLVGWNAGGTITQAHATGTVGGTLYVGGLVGVNNLSLVTSAPGLITQAYATGDVKGFGVSPDYIGGLVGSNGGGVITQVYATGAVTGNSFVGGLIGDNLGVNPGISSGNVTQAYATGNVTGTGNYIGGLVGRHGQNATITQAYATGRVQGNNVGGLVGRNEAAINQAYATGDVIGTGGAVGGLIGFNDAAVTQVYSTGKVTGSGIYVGGLVGFLGGHLANAYWDIDTSGTLDGVGIASPIKSGFTGIHTSAAFTAGTYAGFDFANAWFMIEGSTRPLLRSEYSTNIVNAHQLQLMAMNLGASYTLGANIDLSVVTGAANQSQMWNTSTGFSPIGDSTTNFTGTFDGQGHTIANLFIDRPSTDYVGLFGYMGWTAELRNVGLVDGSVTGRDSVGSLAGVNSGAISTAYATVAVSGRNSVGGLAGSSGGYNGSSITGTISTAYATGTVTGNAQVGGLVGSFGGRIRNAYATGSVTGGSSVGGLVGLSFSPAGGEITNTYATGSVTGSGSYVGGLVGNLGFAFSVTSSFWNTTVSGSIPGIGNGTVPGATGLTTAEFQDTSGFMARASGWNFNTTWAPPSSGYYPVLYALTPVAWVSNTVTTSTYGSSTATVTSVSSAGGPAAYVFGPSGDGLTLAGGTAVVNPATNAGTTTSALATTNGSQTSTGGVAYRTFYYGTHTQTVNQAALTVTASGSQTYGSASPSYSFTASGWQNGQGDSNLIGLSYTTTATSTSNAGGNYTATANGGTLGGAASGNYIISYADGSMIVTPRPVTVTADAQTQVYGDAVPGLTYTTSSLGAGAALSGSLATSATSSSNVGTYGITQGTLTTASNPNYTVSYVGANVTITARPMTVTADSQSMVYGKAVPTLTYVVGGSGLVNGDSITGALATTASSTANVGSYSITQGTLAASANYALTYTGANVAVTVRPLTVTANGQSMVYGNAVPTLTYGVGGSGLVNGDGLTGALATTASTTANVGSYGITQGTLAASSNYALAYTGANVSVTARPLTVTADGQSMVYGNAVPTLTYAVGGSGLVNGDSLTGALATLASSTANVGTYGITRGTVTASSNYTLTYTGANVAVTARPLTVTADGQSMVYGNAVPTLTYAVGGSGLVNGDSLTGALATTASTTTNVGAYGITQGTLANSNYAITYTGANVSVTARSITVTADAQNMVYGNAVPTLTYVVGGSGLVNGDSLAGALATTAGSTANVGTYGITQGTLANSNYAITYTGANVSVTARPLTVTANGQSMVYGNSLPTLTYVIGGSGLVNGDNLTGALATAATSASNVGSYAITQGTLAASTNYALTYTGANVTVTARPLTVTANGQSMVYGNAVPTLTYGVGGSGLVNGDSLTGALATLASSTANVGTYGITQDTLAASANYKLTYTGANVAVTARPLTVTADNQSRAFGTANPTLTWVLSSGTLINGNSLTGVLGTPADATSPAGTYPILQNTLAASGNYQLTYVGGVLTVAPAPGDGNTATPAQVAQVITLSSLPTLLVPQPPTDQWIQTSQTVVLIQESESDIGTASSSTSTSASGSGCSGSSFSSACEGTPHPDNQNFGRWLKFQAQSGAAR